MLNTFFMLNLLPGRGAELEADPELFDSFAWELLRHNGPDIMFDAPADKTIATSAGAHHRVKSGTRLLAHLGMSQRDPAIWKDPHNFKAARFKPLPPRDLRLPDAATGAEPLPTIGFGCPLGMIDDEQQYRTSHQCPFTPAAHPFMKDYIRLLVRDFDWRLSPETAAAVSAGNGNGSALQVDLGPQVVRGGPKAALDMVPKVKDGMRFESFRSKERSAP
jgi:cytochrome P450